jgi:hypothetical protein
MQEKKTTSPGKTEDDLTKVQEACEDVETFLDKTRDTNDAINCLMHAIESIWERLNEQFDDDTIAEEESHRARTLLALLAEQAEKLQNQAVSYNVKLAAFVRK